MKIIKAAALGWMIWWLGPPLWALSVRTPGKEIALDDLRIGQSYQLAEKARDPAIVNTGDEPIRVQMRIAAPKVSELVDGYEPIPSLSWIQAKSSWMTLKPGEKMPLSGVIVIPKREKFAGGQYQIEWLGEAKNMKGSQLTFSSRLLLDIGDRNEELAKTTQEVVQKSSLSFALAPAEGNISDVSLGKSVNLSKDNHVSLKVINPNDVNERLDIKVEKKSPDEMKMRDGFTAAPNPHFLKINRRELRIDAGKIVAEEFTLNIPNENRYRDRNWFFIVSVKILNDQEHQTKYWALYVQTKPEVKQ